MATRYMFLLYSDESGMADVTPEQWDQMLQAHNAWAESVHVAGAAIVSGEALAPSTTSTTVRKNGGSPTVTDGPFAETKEALGGFYLIEAEDLDAAIAIAKTCPAALGGVEVRPVMVFD